jgi:hypothetical protein
MISAQVLTPQLGQEQAPFSTAPSWRRLDHPTGHNRFRQIFLDHWDRWCDLRLEDEVPYNQRTYVCTSALSSNACALS